MKLYFDLVQYDNVLAILTTLLSLAVGRKGTKDFDEIKELIAGYTEEASKLLAFSSDLNDCKRDESEEILRLKVSKFMEIKKRSQELRDAIRKLIINYYGMNDTATMLRYMVNQYAFYMSVPVNDVLNFNIKDVTKPVLKHFSRSIGMDISVNSFATSKLLCTDMTVKEVFVNVLGINEEDVMDETSLSKNTPANRIE